MADAHFKPEKTGEEEKKEQIDGEVLDDNEIEMRLTDAAAEQEGVSSTEKSETDQSARTEIRQEETGIVDQAKSDDLDQVSEGRHDTPQIPVVVISDEVLPSHRGDEGEAELQTANVSIAPIPGEADVNQSKKETEKGKVTDSSKEEEEEMREKFQLAELDNISEEEESEEEFDRDEAIEHYKSLLNEFEKNQSGHNRLQHKIAEYLAKKKAEDRPDPGRNVTDQEQRFQKCMDALEQLQHEAAVLRNDFEIEEQHLKQLRREKQEQVDTAWDTFTKFVKERAITAVHSRTGRRLNSQEVEQYLGMLERKDKDATQVRLENVKLHNRINKLEMLIQRKEQLAEGLHMIDFEQLRINNVDLNEKIEERNEEIQKLQRKVTSTVQVLAHLKEKLQFVQGKNTGRDIQLKELDQEVAKKRDALNRLKQAKDVVRNKNTYLKQRGGLVSHPALLIDFEEKLDLRASTRERLQDVQQRHSELALKCNTLKHKIDQVRSINI